MINQVKYAISTLAFLVLATGLFAQPEPPSNLQLQELRSWLKANWHDGHHESLGYNEARKQMYGYIDNEDGLIECVYTGFTQQGGYVTLTPSMLNI